MLRLFALLGSFVLMVLFVVGIWVAAQPPLATLIVPGATDVQIIRLSWNEWKVTYHAPDAASLWSSSVEERLKASNWIAEGTNEYGALSRTYTHSARIGVGELWEWAFVTVDPRHLNVAEIRFRRWVHLPWLPDLTVYKF